MQHRESSATAFDAKLLGPSVLSSTQSYRLRAKHIDQDFLIDLAAPLVPVAEDHRLPVIYVLDGNLMFGMTAQACRMMQMGPSPLPPALVVGIGYAFDPAQDSVHPLALRARDLTPWVDESQDRQFRATPPPFGMTPDMAMGGAAAFLAFIEEELKPFVADRYLVDDGDQTLVGMSLGGLFALNTLFTTQTAFQRYIALSPSAHWDNRRLFQAEASAAFRARDLPARLFLGVGALEEAQDADARMVSNLYELEARLRARRYPNLDLTLQVFADESHMTVFLAAMTRGLRWVFADQDATQPATRLDP
jgi:predicted alpha/beta superfamily hydrolase